MAELSHDLIRRLLVAVAVTDPSDLMWHTAAGELQFSANCSDLFEWGTADTEPIDSAEDVSLYEMCLENLLEVKSSMSPVGPADLYAIRRRVKLPEPWFLSPTGPYYAGDTVVRLIRLAVAE